MSRRIKSFFIALTLIITMVVTPVFADTTGNSAAKASSESMKDSVVTELHDPVVTYVDTEIDPEAEFQETIHTEWDCIWFGAYYQSNDESKESIKWRVLSVDGNDAFIMSDAILDGNYYDSDPQLSNYIEYSTWYDCSVREWLNNEFLMEAFSEKEQMAIKTTVVDNPDNPYEKSRGGKVTEDKIYLLSIQEACNTEYGFNEDFKLNSATRTAVNTAYAQNHGANSMTSWLDGSFGGNWALRSPGRYPEYPYSVPTASSAYNAYIATYDGSGNSIGSPVWHYKVGIRPCMHIDLSVAEWKYAGKVVRGAESDGAQEETITVEEKSASGTLFSYGGCKVRWDVDYYEESTGRKYYGQLNITVDGSDESVAELPAIGSIGDTAPWLTETGLPKDEIASIRIVGTKTNMLSVGEELFKGYSGVRRVVLSHVANIFDGAFEDCTRLREVDGFGEDLYSIGDRAFKNCTLLQDLLQIRYKIEGWYEIKYTFYPENLCEIGDEAFMGDYQLTDFYLYDSVYQIGADAFSGCNSITIHCNKDSYAQSYAEANDIRYIYMTSVTGLTGFNIKRDGWSFVNTGSVFGEGENYYISDEDMKKYTPRQREIVKKNQKKWGGSCFGMSSVAVLSKMGVIKPDSIQSGKSTLYSISKPNNDKVESIINFFHFQQYFPAYIYRAAEFSKMDDRERLSVIENYAEKAMDGEQPFLLTYYYPPDEDGKIFGHAIVGYGVEHGNYEIARTDNLLVKKEYKSRILLYNCNNPGVTEYMYYNKESGDWIFPRARDASTIGVAIRDRNVLDSAQYGTEEDHFFKSYIYKSENPEFLLSYKGITYLIAEPGTYADGEVVVYQPSVEPPQEYEESSEVVEFDDSLNHGQDTLIAVMPEDSECSIAPNNNSDVTLLCDTGNRLFSIDCSNFVEADFGASCSVSLTGVKGNLSLKLVQDEPTETLEWNVTEISGNALNGDVSMEENSNGVVLGCPDQGKVSVEVSDEEKSENISFTTDGSSVLLNGKMGDIGVYTDPDGDENYNSEVPSETTTDLTGDDDHGSGQATTDISNEPGNTDDPEPQPEEPVHQHSFTEWTVVRPATELAAGEEIRTCTECGEEETQKIAKLAPTLKSVKISKPKAAKKSAIIKWKKVSKKNLKKIKKIQIQYSTDKKFRKGVKTKYVSAKKTSYKIKKLKKGKKYYVRIRAYTKKGKTVHISKWSKTKTVKAK